MRWVMLMPHAHSDGGGALCPNNPELRTKPGRKDDDSLDSSPAAPLAEPLRLPLSTSFAGFPPKSDPKPNREFPEVDAEAVAPAPELELLDGFPACCAENHAPKELEDDMGRLLRVRSLERNYTSFLIFAQLKRSLTVRKFPLWHKFVKVSGCKQGSNYLPRMRLETSPRGVSCCVYPVKPHGTQRIIGVLLFDFTWRW